MGHTRDIYQEETIDFFIEGNPLNGKKLTFLIWGLLVVFQFLLGSFETYFWVTS